VPTAGTRPTPRGRGVGRWRGTRARIYDRSGAAGRRRGRGCRGSSRQCGARRLGDGRPERSRAGPCAVARVLGGALGRRSGRGDGRGASAVTSALGGVRLWIAGAARGLQGGNTGGGARLRAFGPAPARAGAVAGVPRRSVVPRRAMTRRRSRRRSRRSSRGHSGRGVDMRAPGLRYGVRACGRDVRAGGREVRARRREVRSGARDVRAGGRDVIAGGRQRRMRAGRLALAGLGARADSGQREQRATDERGPCKAS
jgi:hypothetical protein